MIGKYPLRTVQFCIMKLPGHVPAYAGSYPLLVPSQWNMCVCTHTHLAPDHGVDQLILQAAVQVVGPTGGCSHGAFLPSSAGTWSGPT